MNNGVFIGGFIGLLVGIAFLAYAHSTKSTVDPPFILGLFFAVAGACIGGAISNARKKKKES